MRERLKQAQPLVIVLLLVLLTTLGGGYFNEKKENAQIKNQKEKEQQVLKKTLEEKNGQLNDLSRKIEQLLDEKEDPVNEPLTKAVNALFSLLFDYDSSNKEQTVAKRKDKATVYATEQGLSGVFPRDADKVVPSVVTVSQLDKAPEIYRTTQKDTGKEKTALVRLEYSVRIAGSQTQRGNFIYKVTFNEESKKFTTIENLGEENQ